MDFGHRLVYSKLSSVSLSQLVTINFIVSKVRPLKVIKSQNVLISVRQLYLLQSINWGIHSNLIYFNKDGTIGLH